MFRLLFFLTLLAILSQANAQHADNSLINIEKRNEWIQSTSKELKNIKPGDSYKKVDLKITEYNNKVKHSVRILKEGMLDLPNGNWIYITTSSSHNNPEIGDIILAIDNKRRIFYNEGHVCGGIIHFETDQIDELKNQRAWIMIQPVPFMETGAAWSRAVALTAPEGMDEESFLAFMASAEMLDMTVPFSVQTPQWANYEPLSIKYTKRVGGQYFGLGRNNAHCRASFHLGTHMDGEKHFHAAGRTIGEMPFDKWFGPGVIVDISAVVSNSSVYTPQMIEDIVDVRQGDILIIKTGWHKYGWASPDSDEFRYMIKHPGPSPDFADWCIEKDIKWLGIDCVAMEHPMNTIQRIWHPKTFAEANQKLIDQYGKDWDEMYPLDKYYQDMHLNLFSKGIIHAENLGYQLADAEDGRYFIGCFVQKGMELAPCWARFVAFRES